jgi:ATP-dependent RNA helicase DDX52/ROK1
LNALKESNIHSLWGVQCAVGGSLLEGRDVICVAPTGSGKTLAYVLPTLVRLGDPARTLASSGTEKNVSEKRDGEKTGKGKTGKEKTGSSSRNEKNGDQIETQGGGGGQGIRALIVVPTHDLAVQIEGVVKAVTRKRGWRCLVLSKATEKAICESSPGASDVVDEDDEALAESGEKDEDGEGDQEKDEDEEEEEEREEEKEVKGKAKKEVKGKGKNSGKKDNGGRLGIDILISTPERLHHLLEEGKISLAS